MTPVEAAERHDLAERRAATIATAKRVAAGRPAPGPQGDLARIALAALRLVRAAQIRAMSAANHGPAVHLPKDRP